ncbi:type I-C CRISPR-associated endonuclease Cas1c [Aeoliella mucimassa]|uniref:CRISPR-associated endonuclease Cas1 n=1 Tax=Aeoliella mucimassa TaxID=2527972 RepID=A0A518AQL8_9BACT|nr:type I-C CRISPR-associated endonuclease Cas1c [Aeoliella mucimassa]QDU57020.1 CRISPR-associated protein Cas4/endonuclease Cas1 fusion [Aeoliella mucimassa]
MKTHLNTLYVTKQGAYLAKDGAAVVVRVDKKPQLRLPLHNLDGIVVFGHVGCSPALMAAAASAGVSISLLTEYGRFLAAIVGFTSGNVLLRREQYRRADDSEKTLALARSFVQGKLMNARTVLLRAARDANEGERKETLTATAKRLSGRLVEVNQATTTDILRGLEGEAATQYFAAFPSLLTRPAKAFNFTKRSRRPPLDPINALLSFVYSLLLHDVRSACEATGLDSVVGYLHRDRPGRPSLALDLMEEFRPYLADRLVFSLVNRQQVTASGFETQETGGVVMDDQTRKRVLVAWQERKQEEIKHPYTGDRMTVGLLPHIQARLLARHLRGDLDAYPPFIWK